MSQEARSRVLHALRCVGAAGVERISAASGLFRGEAERCLRALGNDGLAHFDPGPFGGWALTEPGRAVDDDWLTGQLDRPGVRDRVLDCYGRFLELNPELLQVCSDWQMRTIGGVASLNDHSDDDYDARVLSRLFRLDDSVQTLLAELATTLLRFDFYRARLSAAAEEVMAGNHAYLADGLESYHTVWFQLHEDLLTTLGISREDEMRDPGCTGV